MKKNKFKEFFMSSWAIDNRTTTYLLTIIVVMLGMISYNTLPKENFPEISIPTVYVGTPYPGTTPDRMEEAVTYYIEKELKSITGVKEIKSNSIQDFSIVVVEFETDVDIAEAKKEVKDAVDRAKSNLPNDLPSDPLVQDINLSEIPIMFLNVYGDIDPEVLKSYSEDLQDRIEQLPEIRRVDLVGADEREVQINIDLYKMQASGISFGNIEQAIGQRDVIISGGNIELGNEDYALQVVGKFQEVSEIGNVVIRNSRGKAVYLKDIVTEKISIAPEKKKSYARLDGNKVITLNVIKKGGENLVLASEQINTLLKEFKEDLPASMEGHLNVEITQDQSLITKRMLDELTNTIIIGFILVTLVLMFFMGLRDAMFVGFSVPLSSLMAFVVLPWLGFTLNLVVLFTFIFALGIVVDNAIVVIENTHRIFNTERIPIAQAAKKAAGEVIAPVFAGTLTTMAPFLPLAFWEGIIGEFMFFLPITIIITLSASLLVAYVINPVFAVTFMRRDDETQKISLKGFLLILGGLVFFTVISYLGGARTMGNVLLISTILIALFRFVLNPAIKGFQRKVIPAMIGGYRSVLQWCLQGRRPYFVLLATIMLLIGSMGYLSRSSPKIIFFPDTDPNQVFVYHSADISTNINKTNEITLKMERLVNEALVPYQSIVKSVITNVAIGAGDQNDLNRTNSLPHKSKISIEFVESKLRKGLSTMRALEDIRANLKDQFPSTSTIVVEKEASGPPTAKPVNIEIKGEEYGRIIAVARELKDYLDNLKKKQDMFPGVEELKWNLDEGKNELRVDVDQVKAAQLGMNTVQVALALRTAVFGSEVSKFRDGEDEYPIMVRLDERFRGSINDLKNMRINYRDMSTGLFHDVPISAVAEIEDTTALGGINRIDLKKEVTISSNVLSDYNPNETVQEVIDEMEKWKEANAAKLSGISIDMTGELEEQAETSAFLGTAMGTSILLIFLILVAQFNSIPKVFIILMQILLSMIGVFLGFALTGMDISIVMVGVGIVSLAGIVVNNGIILLDFIAIMKKRGKGTRDAIIEGGSVRFTPVLLTASSTLLGLLPLALSMNINFATLFSELDPQIFFGGDNAAFWGPLSWTVIFGLSFATLVTLIIVPVLYYIFYVAGIKNARRRMRISRRIGRMFAK